MKARRSRERSGMMYVCGWWWCDAGGRGEAWTYVRVYEADM